MRISLFAAASLTLASTAFAQCTPAPSGLVAWWRGERNVNDSAGQSNGALSGDCGYDSTYVGLGFTFYTGVATSPDTPALHFGTGDFTIEYWMSFWDFNDNSNGVLSKDTYAGSLGDYQGIIINICNSCGDGGFGSGTPGFGFETRNVHGTGPDTHCRISTLNFAQFGWYHITCVRRQQVLTLYVNGTPRVSVTEPAPTNVTTTAPVTFGALTPISPQYFSGQLDEISFYNRALSQAEISAIVAAGSAGKCTHCPSDFNNDSIVDFFDYLDFVNAFAALDPTADFNSDSVIDFFDYLDFVSAFSSGC